MRVRLHADAESELLAAASWYEDQRARLGDDLIEELDQAIAATASA